MLSYSTGTSGFGPQVGLVLRACRRCDLLNATGLSLLLVSALPCNFNHLVFPRSACSHWLCASSAPPPPLRCQVDKVKEATALVKAARPDLFVEGGSASCAATSLGHPPAMCWRSFIACSPGCAAWMLHALASNSRAQHQLCARSAPRAQARLCGHPLCSPAPHPHPCV